MSAVSALDISIIVEVHNSYFIHPLVLKNPILSHQDVYGALI